MLGEIRLSDGRMYERQWGLTTTTTIAGSEKRIPSLIDDFVSIQKIFRCPFAVTARSGLNYLYNDLAANESQAGMTHPGASILIAEGDDRLRNVGHSKSRSRTGDDALLRPRKDGQGPELLLGAAVGDAATRHRGGAYYGFADGHVKWMKPEVVFFPPRTSNSSSHREAKTGQLLGPEPSGAKQDGMTFQGRTYKATFHVR